MASRLIDAISKKKKQNKLHVQHTFSSNLSLVVVLHDYNAVLYG